MSDQPSWQKPVFIDPKQTSQTSQFQEPPMEPHVFAPDSVTATDDSELVLTETPPPKKKRRLWSRIFGAAITAVLTGAVVSEVYRFISWGYELNPILGGICTAVTGITIISGTVWLYGSFKGLRQLKEAERLQQEAITLQSQKTHGNAAPFLKKLDKLYDNTDLNQPFKDAIRQVDSAYNDSEIIRYISDHALREQDAAARKCVQRNSVQSGLMVALSPYATFDMYLVGWRNIKMLRELAEIYGIAPGAATQWQLLKRVLHNIAFAGLSEITIHAGSHLLGASITTTLSARAGQGVGASLFTARSGFQAIKLCRPLPLTKDAQKELNKISESIIADVARQSSESSQK